MDKKHLLIVGQDSLIGRSIVQDKSRFPRAIGTSRREDAALHLDLNAPELFQLENLTRFNAAVICAAVTKLDQCKANPENTTRVNVFNTFALISRLAGLHGVFTVVLSSSCVFDGEQEFPEINTPVSPRTDYGRQKAALENLVSGMPNVAVVRPTKVTESLFIADNWRAELLQGKIVRPLSDYCFSDVPMNTVKETIRRVIELRRPGVYHCSGATTHTYADLAKGLARQLGVDQNLVQPQTIAESGMVMEHSARHSTLGLNMTRALLDCEPMATGRERCLKARIPTGVRAATKHLRIFGGEMGEVRDPAAAGERVSHRSRNPALLLNMARKTAHIHPFNKTTGEAPALHP